jgi:hypothetical protein
MQNPQNTIDTFGGDIMEEKTIKNIPAIPFSMMLGAVSGVIGFVVAVIMAIFWIPLIAAGNSSAVPGFGLLFGMGAIIMIIVIPIMAFIAGFIQGLIVSVVYNFLAPRIGGIKLKME